MNVSTSAASNTNASDNSLSMAVDLTTHSSGTSSTATATGLSQIVAELTSTITGSNGKLDTSTPLGQMLDSYVQSQLPDGVASQVGDPANSLTSTGISQSLTKMIQDVLGPDSGATSSTQSDLESLVQGNLSKYKLDSLLTPNTSRGGSNFSTQGIDPDVLAAVGQFMDANPDTFPQPNQGTSEAKIGGWTDELNAQSAGDNYLNGAETDAVSKALEMIGQVLQGGVPSGSSTSSQGTCGQGASPAFGPGQNSGSQSGTGLVSDTRSPQGQNPLSGYYPTDTSGSSINEIVDTVPVSNNRQAPQYSANPSGGQNSTQPAWAQTLSNTQAASDNLLAAFNDALSEISGASGGTVSQSSNYPGFFGQGSSGGATNSNTGTQGFFGSNNNSSQGFFGSTGGASTQGSSTSDLQSSINELIDMLQGGSSTSSSGQSTQSSAQSTSQYIMSKLFS